jgi:hypothetical protein
MGHRAAARCQEAGATGAGSATALRRDEIIVLQFLQERIREPS